MVNSPLYASQIVKLTGELEEENRNIEASAEHLKDTPKNRKLLDRLNAAYRFNRRIIETRKELERNLAETRRQLEEEKA